MDEVDRLEAQSIADLLGIDVSTVPEDHETLTAALWDVVGLGGQPMPESIETRWEVIVEVLGSGTREAPTSARDVLMSHLLTPYGRCLCGVEFGWNDTEEKWADHVADILDN